MTSRSSPNVPISLVAVKWKALSFLSWYTLFTPNFNYNSVITHGNIHISRDAVCLPLLASPGYSSFLILAQVSVSWPSFQQSHGRQTFTMVPDALQPIGISSRGCKVNPWLCWTDGPPLVSSNWAQSTWRKAISFSGPALLKLDLNSTGSSWGQRFLISIQCGMTFKQLRLIKCEL